MHHRFKVLTLSGAAVLIPALFVASSVSSAPHDGPGANCWTHTGVTYVSGGRVYSDASGGCNANHPQFHRHSVSLEIEWSTWHGWEGIGINEQTALNPPFGVWLLMDRAANCPRNYRGHVLHFSRDDFPHTRNSRFTNTTSC